MQPAPGAASAAANGCRTDDVSGSGSVPGADGVPGAPRPDAREAPGGTPQSAELDKRERFRSYHKPIRPESGRASAESSPRLNQSVDRLSSPSTDGAPETGIIAIGMALGSPTYTSDVAVPGWRPQFTTTVTAGAATPQNASEGEISPKSKPRKWGIFGRSWSKRVKGTPSAAQQDGQPVSPPSSSLLGRSISSARPRLGPRDKEPMPSPPPRSIARSHTEPMLNERYEASTSASRRRNGTPNRPADVAPDEAGRPRGVARGRSPATPSSDLGEPLLDVEIPDVTMERYSVMFGHLLQNGNAMSLLARRQAAQDRIKAIREGSPIKQAAQKAPEKLPSSVPGVWTALPSPTRVAPRVRDGSSQSPPRMRSNTSPATLPSPSRPAFKAETPPLGRKATIHIADSTARCSRTDDATAPGRAADRPPLISKFHRKSSSTSSHHVGASRTSVDKPASITGGEEHFQVRVRSPERNKASVATWNTTYAPLAAATPRSFASRDEERSLPPSPILYNIDDTPLQTSQRAPRDPVEVSIARQISVSRQQRALLGPLQIHSLDSRRINETKSSTPRIIDPLQDRNSPKAMHRKSERVIVERV